MDVKTVDRKHVRDFEPLPVTRDMITEYIDSLIKQGKSDITVKAYRKYLNEVYDFLPGEKLLTADVLDGWVESILNEGFSASTVNLRGSAVNGFLQYFGASGPVIKQYKGAAANEVQAELTLDEYHRILEAARDEGMFQNYLLIKTFASVGINVRDLPYFTIENCTKGSFMLPCGRTAVVPESLQNGVRQYCRWRGICSGPVFLTKNGKNLNNSNIIKTMHMIAGRAGVAPEKCNPRTLLRLYSRVKKDIEKQMELLSIQTFDRLM